jgi:glycosyltransferase involved in cell wall biosynthesis
MACGRAVIVSRAGGAVELFEDGVAALGFTPGEVGQLASTIVSLVKDGTLRSTLGEQGRATAVRRFSRTRLASELVALYHDVLR